MSRVKERYKVLRYNVTADSFPHWLKKYWKPWKKCLGVCISMGMVDEPERDLEIIENESRVWGILGEEGKLMQAITTYIERNLKKPSLVAPFQGGRVGKAEQLEMEAERISARIKVAEVVGKAALDMETSLPA